MRMFSISEVDLEGLLAAAEYSKRAEEHVQEIQNCPYMQRVTKPVADTIDRLRHELHAARATPDPSSNEPLSSEAGQYLLSMLEEIRKVGMFPYHVHPLVQELRLKHYIQPGQQCVFEKWGSEKQYKPTAHAGAFYRLTGKGENFIRETLGENYENATRN